MVYVLDASFYAASILPDEHNKEALRFFSSVSKDDQMYVPHLWWHELGNILKTTVRKKRLEYADALVIVSRLSALPVNTDSESGGSYASALLGLAHDYGITTYDAAYLELAARKGAVLGTLDQGFKAAALKHGVETL
jgi:predicted nucleic acid-binding protein